LIFLKTELNIKWFIFGTLHKNEMNDNFL
jgi:hypothetical protein